MNRLLVRDISDGLAAYLRAGVASAPSVVVARDGRRRSRDFAHEAATALAAGGVEVRVFEAPVPVPLLSFAVGALGASAGVMITASHNPAADNGYKVFWENGAQVIPPHDVGIAAAAEAAAERPARVPAPERIQTVPPEVEANYLVALEGMRVHRVVGARIVYTPLHGVGGRLVELALRAAGHMDLHVVSEQATPDGDFPTVTSPNPEDHQALALALALARRVGADVVLVNDPDADRLAVALPDGDGWQILGGDPLGALLADDLLTHDPHPGDGPRALITNLLASGLLAAVADHHGALYQETRIGFRWIGAAAAALEASGGRVVLGCEEALGYSPWGLIRDKDGVSAALLVADLVS